jgi:hypothetical protein
VDFKVKYDISKIRHVKTVFTLQELNNASDDGHKVIIRKTKKNKELYQHEVIFQNVSTGEFVSGPSRNFYRQYGESIILDEADWKQIAKTKRYTRKQTLLNDWAAYLLPKNVEVGEELYVENIIEDIYVSEFWGSKIFAVDGVAVWIGTTLQFKRELYKDNELFLVG